MTQSNLADLLGRNQRTISNWEKGTRDPGSENLRSIAEALRVTPTELIGHNNAPSDDLFQIIVKDDDMYPDIHRDDTITVSKSESHKDGDFVIVSIDGSQKCRKIFGHGGLVTLIALDPKIGMQVYSDDEITIIGKVIEIVRKLN